jgi:hypothetical protein
MPYRWLMTSALLGVGACHITTGLALRPASAAGRIMLIFGGVSGMLIAANPETHGGSVAHVAFSCTGVVLMTLWPVAAMRGDPGAPWALRPPAAWAAGLVTLAMALWFTAELARGTELGLAERAVTADQSLWPLVVVLSILVARHRLVDVPEEVAAFRSR